MAAAAGKGLPDTDTRVRIRRKLAVPARCSPQAGGTYSHARTASIRGPRGAATGQGTFGKGSKRSRALAGSIVSNAPWSSCVFICRIASTTAVPIASGLTFPARSCTTLGLLPWVAASIALKSRSWVRTKVAAPGMSHDLDIRSTRRADRRPVIGGYSGPGKERYPTRRKVHVNEELPALARTTSRSSASHA